MKIKEEKIKILYKNTLGKKKKNGLIALKPFRRERKREKSTYSIL